MRGLVFLLSGAAAFVLNGPDADQAADNLKQSMEDGAQRMKDIGAAEEAEFNVNTNIFHINLIQS